MRREYRDLRELRHRINYGSDDEPSNVITIQQPENGLHFPIFSDLNKFIRRFSCERLSAWVIP